jgi:hypothetical protein
MNAYRDGDDEEDRDDDDVDSDYGDDYDDPDEEPTVPCPYCRREIPEDVLQCPSCERYISAEDHPGRRQPVWIIVTAVICLGMAIWWAFSA